MPTWDTQERRRPPPAQFLEALFSSEGFAKRFRRPVLHILKGAALLKDASVRESVIFWQKQTLQELETTPNLKPGARLALYPSPPTALTFTLFLGHSRLTPWAFHKASDA